jgi:hypothetical protein
MDDVTRLVDATVINTESASFYIVNSLTGVLCGRTQYHVIIVYVALLILLPD